jgi:hypothetical protein
MKSGDETIVTNTGLVTIHRVLHETLLIEQQGEAQITLPSRHMKVYDSGE